VIVARDPCRWFLGAIGLCSEIADAGAVSGLVMRLQNEKKIPRPWLGL
jgi:hypothetical protein